MNERSVIGTLWLVVNNAGFPLEATPSMDIALERIQQLNSTLSDLERMSGLQYLTFSVPIVTTKHSQLVLP